MDDFMCFLVTILYDESLLRCALKIDKWDLPEGTIDMVWDDPNSADSRDILHKLLPLHVRNCGPVVEVTRLFDIHVRDAAVRLRERDIANPSRQWIPNGTESEA